MFQLATFRCDITPPIGHPLCAGWYPAATGILDHLTANGLILVAKDQKPVVLCALDWAELSNHDYNRWRAALAEAVGTDPVRVAVHCTHCHDSPWPDRDAQDILDEHGHRDLIMAGSWCEDIRAAVADAARQSISRLEPCTHVATGQARVDRVASNRRIMGDDGKVKAVRWTKTIDPAIRAEPEGLIDPMLKTVSFWHGDRKLAAMHYYAVHPTSLDGTGQVTCEFVGLARDRRSREDDNVPHIYFTGCGGNITAGKYNEGDLANREAFAGRILSAMRESENAAKREAITGLDWRVAEACLPPRDDMIESNLLAVIAKEQVSNGQRSRAALMLTYLRRKNLPIPITALHINEAIAMLHLPGEAFIEYQLAAYEQRPDAFVAVASYGDLGTGYICMAQSFDEGGYEPQDAFVGPGAEAIMREAIGKVMHL